jgi:hypothetical protein
MKDPPLSPEIDSRIFVVGVPRSGTTLVQSLLAAHSTTTSFTESHFFDRHFKLLPLTSKAILTRDPDPRLHEFLVENGEEPPDAAAWFGAQNRGVLWLRPFLPFQTGSATLRLLRVLDELTLRRRRSSWIEKTPRHLRYIHFLQGVSGPQSRLRFVHVIRNGLEVVASLHQASKSWESSYNLESCARRWNAEVGYSLRRIMAPTDHFVFYEELTSRPEATLRRLLVALGLDWEPDILERYGGVSDRLITKREKAWKANVGRGIWRSSASDRALTGEQRQRVSRILRPGLYEQIFEGAQRRAGETEDTPLMESKTR